MKIPEKIHKSWYNVIGLLVREPFLSFEKILQEESYNPKYEDIFNVFEMPLQDIKVVILGNHPYYTPNYNMGYAWAIPENQKGILPLNTLYTERGKADLKRDFDSIKEWQTLQHWREQGVFLLNTELTVGSNQDRHTAYWAGFMHNVIRYISIHNPCIWIAWGKQFIPYISKVENSYFIDKYEKANLLNEMPVLSNVNYILHTGNPVSDIEKNLTIYGNHFNLTNNVLKKLNKPQIYW